MREGRVSVGGEIVLDPARDVDEHDDVRGRRRAGRARGRARRLRGQQAGRRRLDGEGHARPPGRHDLVDGGVRLYPVGRLDADTTGLILLTNDGELANRLTHPRYEVPSTYVAKVQRRVREEPRAASGCARASSSTTARPRPRRSARCGPGVLELTIHEGRKRQVRRMCEAVGHRGAVAARASRFGPLRARSPGGGRARGRLRAAGGQGPEGGGWHDAPPCGCSPCAAPPPSTPTTPRRSSARPSG